ncbi:MAG: threonine--tRNA ligase [Deltaproteobacteria bacterium]|nr:threonine--tRNA ligase [Deltaproteobacteria bacterium]
MEKFRTSSDKDYRFALRHSAAHLMAQAVIRLYPQAKLTVGPATDEGFFYDIDLGGVTLTPEDLARVEETMKKIVKENLKVTYSEMPREEAKSFLKKAGQTYKVELIDSIPTGEPITFYSQGEFIDLCEGPHVKTTGELKHFKLLYTSGAYWKADQNNAMLQRIYGTAFESAEALDAHLKMLEEAKKRDHRELGKRLDLFSFHEWSPGIPFFHPKGTIVFNEMQNLIRDHYFHSGYKEVLTPLLYDAKLYHRSGHYDTFKENMFFTEDGEMSLKPMNCPGHCLLYKHSLWSYKDLPLRFAEFSKLHRNERAGALHGMTRVRAMSQDDAHIYCTENQVEQEAEGFFNFLDLIYNIFGFKEYEVKLATRPEKRIGSDEVWDKAEKIMEDLLKKRKVTYEIAEGEGAIYGPKYEFHVKDAIGRSWQLATLQLDFALPERFELEYVGEDSKRHRPVMLHRAIFGSLERFFAVYLEHCEGYFPTWLAPIQIYLVPIRENHFEYAKKLEAELKQKGIRVFVDTSEGNMGGKVREATVQRVPYIAVIGDKEMEADSLALKSPKFGDFGVLKRSEVVAALENEITNRVGTPSFKVLPPRQK